LVFFVFTLSYLFYYLFICLGLDVLMANLPWTYYTYISVCSYRPIYQVRISRLEWLSRLIL
jgi:hypothetical protein